MDRVLGFGSEPDRGSHRGQGGGPVAAQPARTEMRLRLTAAVAPGRPHGTPALATQRADDSVGVTTAEESMARQTLGGKEELLDGLAKHAARDSQRRA